MLLLHWMLVLVLAMDLVSSPWHAHHHDGGPDGTVAHAAQVDDGHDFVHGHGHGHGDYDGDGDGDGGVALHLTADHFAHVSHSVLALRTSPIQLASPQLQENPQDLDRPYWLFVGLTPPLVEASDRWQPGRVREPIPLFRVLPPVGRAPPTLHA